jgi:hypothetical protein
MADIIRYASYLYLYRKSWLGAKPYNNIYYFNFPIMNFPFICSNIPAVPTYGVYISQLIQCSGACASYHDFPNRVLLITRKLLDQRFRVIFDVLRYHHDCIPFHHDLVYRYRISVSQFRSFQLPMQSEYITTHVVSSNPAHDELYFILHYVIKFVSDLLQVGGFLQVLPFLHQ